MLHIFVLHLRCRYFCGVNHQVTWGWSWAHGTELSTQPTGLKLLMWSMVWETAANSGTKIHSEAQRSPRGIRPSILMFVGFSTSLTLPVLRQMESQLQKSICLINWFLFFILLLVYTFMYVVLHYFYQASVFSLTARTIKWCMKYIMLFD